MKKESNVKLKSIHKSRGNLLFHNVKLILEINNNRHKKKMNK